jgi:hypothetical protein
MDQLQQIGKMLEYLSGRSPYIRKIGEARFEVEDVINIRVLLGKLRDNGTCTIDFNKRIVHVYGWDINDHNGNQYNCIDVAFPIERLEDYYQVFTAMFRLEIEREIKKEEAASARQKLDRQVQVRVDQIISSE